MCGHAPLSPILPLIQKMIVNIYLDSKCQKVLTHLSRPYSSKSCIVKLSITTLSLFNSDVPDHLDKSTSDSLVFLHPSAMQLGGFSIGQPVIVDNCHILTAWPCTRLSQTSVGVSQNVLDNTLKLQPNVGVLVYTPTHPQIPATELCLSVRSVC